MSIKNYLWDFVFLKILGGVGGCYLSFVNWEKKIIYMVLINLFGLFIKFLLLFFGG